MNLYDTDLPRTPANFQPLTPLDVPGRVGRGLSRPHRDHPWRAASTYAEFYARSRRLASALAKRGDRQGRHGFGDARQHARHARGHYGVPMAGAVLNTLNTRLDAAIIAFIARPCRSQGADHRPGVLARSMKEALKLLKGASPLVIDYDEPEFRRRGERLGAHRL